MNRLESPVLRRPKTPVHGIGLGSLIIVVETFAVYSEIKDVFNQANQLPESAAYDCHHCQLYGTLKNRAKKLGYNRLITDELIDFGMTSCFE